MILSVKLAMWEAALDEYVKSVQWVPQVHIRVEICVQPISCWHYVLQTLKLGKTLKISIKEVLQKTGELISLRFALEYFSK